MPIPAKGVVIPAPDPNTPGGGSSPPPLIPPVAPSRRRRISWILPAVSSGEGHFSEIPFTGDITGTHTGIIVQPGVQGLDAPPFSLTLDELPALDGSVYRHVRATTREVMLPLFLWAPDRTSLRKLKDDLLMALDPARGPGTLAVTEYDAEGNETVRYLDCYYTGGAEGDESQGYDFICQAYGVTFQAPDPLWYGPKVSPPPDRFTSTVPVNFFTGKSRGAPDEHVGNFLGIHLSKATYVQDKTYLIMNPGNREGWPVWRFTGTGAKRVTVEQLDTVKFIGIDYEFDSFDDYVEVDTRPGYKTITNKAGENLWPQVDTGTALFPLIRGSNRIRVDFEPVNESATVDAEFSYSFYPRYLGV